MIALVRAAGVVADGRDSYRELTVWFKLLLIGAGGAAGAIARYLLSGWVTRGTFPLGTLTVNGLGCLLIGFLGAVLTGPWLMREEYRFAITVGFLGGLTTFSTYAFETLSLAGDRQWAHAAVNVLLNNGLGLVAVWFGYRLAERIYGV